MIPRLPSYPMPTPDTLPAQRVPWTPDPARAALLVHDLQAYFLDFYDPARPPIPNLLRAVADLTAHARALGIPVVYTAQPGAQDPADRALLTDFWGPGLPDDPAVTRIHPLVAPRPGDTVLTKWRYSAFQRTPQMSTCAGGAATSCSSAACTRTSAACSAPPTRSCRTCSRS
ncbi:isochorismatase family protein [Deinococcus sp. RM]|uniref:isochorismatase family protein n=1 Tax=Deinococcus sp. RM TaxID=2316359 RepID=UPI00210071C9|nr:isochorismatase family protein [Deinococcus sp. RM]